MTAAQQIPQLRFKEFDGEWNSSKFKELVKINQGLQIQIADRLLEQEKDSYFYITNEFLRANSDKKYFVKNPSDSVLCNTEDILMTRTGNTGQVVTNVEGVFHNNFFRIKYPRSTINKDYLVSFLRLPSTQKTILRYAGTSTIPDLNHSDFYRIPFVYPPLPEQQKIASFLTAVDSKLEQLTTKKSLLEDYKKGVMQQIFSQELRFKREDGTSYPKWEEKKLGDYTEIIHGDGDWILSKDIVPDGQHKIVQLGNIGLGRYVNKDLKTISSQTFKDLNGTSILKGDLLINRMVDGNLNCCLMPFFGDFITSVDVCWIRENESFINYFLLSTILYSKNQHKLLRLSSGSGRVRISKKNLFERFKFGLPCMEEQTQIANFLSAIDEKIAFVDTQLTHTQDFKKGLLQQMFV